MLSSFYVRNYRSILELRLDFSYGEGKAPNGYKDQNTWPFLEAGANYRLVPCMAYFGANASGKTNLLKAIAELSNMVSFGDTLADYFEPNLLNRKFANTTFHIEFLLDEVDFQYAITYNETGIIEESLEKSGKLLYSVRHLEAEFSEQILSKIYTRDKLAEVLRVECSDGEGKQIKLFLHRIGLGYLGLNSDLKNAFSFFKKRLMVRVDPDPVPLPVIVKLLALALNDTEDAALKKITEIVRRLDIDITELEIDQKKLAANEDHDFDSTLTNSETGMTHGINITATHTDISGNPTKLNFFRHESAGTQRLAGLIGLVLYALERGGVLLVDELESSLHPLLTREIISLFKLRRYNKKGAQLFFTTHNTDILDDSILRISEISLVRKTLANGTLVRRLVEAKEEGEKIRNVTNFRKQYLAGYYSGVPHPAL